MNTGIERYSNFKYGGIKLYIDIDKNKRKKEYRIYLAKPNKEIISNLSELYEPSYSIKMGNVNEIKFSLPYYIDYEDRRRENKNINLLKQKMYLKVEYNNSKEWMIIDEIEDLGEGDEKRLVVTSFSNVYENNHKKIRGMELDAVNPEEYYSNILESSSWRLGEVDPLFKSIYRSFDISDMTVLEAIITGAETYGAVLDFDSENKKISLIDVKSRAKYRGLNINYKNFLNSISRTSSVDEMTTRLYAYGADGMDISNASPSGMPYIEDFSYFIYPFKRDSKKNVLKSSYYMSDELSHAILDLQELRDEYLPQIKEKQRIIDEEINILVVEETTLSDFQFDYSAIMGLLDIAKATEDKDLISRRKQELSVASRALKRQEDTVKGIKSKIEKYERELTLLQNQISTTSFTKELVDELNPFIIEKEFRDERYIDDEELYDDALEKFSENQTPNYVINASIDNIIGSLEEEYYSDKIVLGDIARIREEDMGIDMKSLITEMTFHMDEDSHEITISQGNIDIDGYDRILSILYQTQSATTTISNNKNKWDSVTEVRTEVDIMREESIDATKNRIYAGINESIEIGDRGITLSNPDFPNEMVIMQAGVIALSKDGGETWSTSVSPDGVVADTLIGKLIASNNLIVTNDRGSFKIDDDGMTVDMDSIKIMSGEGDTPENIIDAWNSTLVTMGEFADDNLLNSYEKSQIKKQWESMVKTHSSMIKAIQDILGPETPDNPYPVEYERYVKSYEKMNNFLNNEIQKDGHTILDPSNMNNTTEIDGLRYQMLVSDYQSKKDEFQTVIPMEFSQTSIEQLSTSISLNYVKNGEVVTKLNVSEEGVRIDGRLLSINSKTEFNDDLTMNAGLIKSKDGAITIDLNKGEMNLSKPLTINYVPVATEESIKDLEIGGRNLLLNSSFAYGKDYWSEINDPNSVPDGGSSLDRFKIVDENESPTGKAIRINANIPNVGIVYSLRDESRFNPGREYTLSLKVKGRGNISIALADNIIKRIDSVEEETEHKITFKLANEKDLKILSGEGNTNSLIYAIKLERGSNKTDWSPAPEDVDYKIQEVTAQIKVSEDSIMTEVKNIDGKVSTIDQKADSIRSEVQDVDGRVSSVNQRVSGLSSVVSNKADSSEITQLSNRINLKVDSGDVINQINISSQSIDLSSNRVTLGNVGSFTVENGVLFSENYDGTYTTIKATGDVAFATSSPHPRSTTNARLQIWHNGMLRFNTGSKTVGTLYAEGDDMWIKTSARLRVNGLATEGDVRPEVNDRYWLGNLGNRWHTLKMGTGGIDESSDRRLKSDIKDIPLDLVYYFKDVNPKEFIMNGKKQFGYIAQDVERAMFKYATDVYGIESARKNKEVFSIVSQDESYLGLVYKEVSAIKDAEVDMRIRKLERRVEELENGR